MSRTDTTFRTSVPYPQTAPEYVTPAELASRCAAAVKMSMGSKSYTLEDRRDGAAHLLTHLLRKRTGKGSAADVLRFLDWCESRPATVRMLAVEDIAHIPAVAYSMTALCHEAANYRRSIDRRRKRDDADAQRQAQRFSTGGKLELERPTAPTPEAAHETARELLSALGLPRLGRAYPVAYGAARRMLMVEAQTVRQGKLAGKTTGRAMLTESDATGEQCAAELGLTHSAYRKALSAERIARVIPSVTVRSIEAHADALGIETDASPARKATATRMAATDIGDRANGWRGKEAPMPDAAPVTVRMDPNMIRAAQAPDWTKDLPAGTRARLAHAAAINAANRAKRLATVQA